MNSQKKKELACVARGIEGVQRAMISFCHVDLLWKNKSFKMALFGGLMTQVGRSFWPLGQRPNMGVRSLAGDFFFVPIGSRRRAWHREGRLAGFAIVLGSSFGGFEKMGFVCEKRITCQNLMCVHRSPHGLSRPRKESHTSAHRSYPEMTFVNLYDFVIACKS